MNLFLPFKEKKNQNTETKNIQFTVLIDKQKRLIWTNLQTKGCKNEKQCISI